jgi:anti-sigma B factor antagonist
MPSNVSMTVRRLEGGAGLIAIAGEVTAAAESALADAHTEAGNLGATTVILDFSELEYMNSSGIGLLVTTLIRAQRQQQRLLAVGLNEHYRQIFALTRLDEAIAIHPTLEQALTSA